MRVYNATISLLFVLGCMNAYGDSTALSPPSTTAMTLCPVIRVNGNNVTSSTSQTFPLAYSSSNCTSVWGGSVGWGFGGFPPLLVFGGGGGTFSPSCPYNYPYIQSVQETWGGCFVPLVCAGGATMQVQCCKYDDPTVSILQGYDAPTSSNPATAPYRSLPPLDTSNPQIPNSTTGTWEPGPDCM